MMKKRILGLAVLLTGYAATSFADIPTEVCAKRDVTSPLYGGGLTFGLTGLYWKSSSPLFEYRLHSVMGANPNQGYCRYLDHNYDWGYKASISYCFEGSGYDANLSYTRWHNNEEDETRSFLGSLPFFGGSFADPGFPASFTLASSVAFTGTAVTLIPGADPISLADFSSVISSLILPINGRDITELKASSDLANQTWDLDFGKAINVGDNFRLRWFGGVRYTYVGHNFNLRTTALVNDVRSSFAFAVPTSTISAADPAEGPVVVLSDYVVVSRVNAYIRDFVNVRSNFNGIGPRLGMDASYYLGCGFGAVGSLSTSLLVGESNHSFSERFQGAGSISFLSATAFSGLSGNPTIGNSTSFLPASVAVANPAFGTPIGIVFNPSFPETTFHYPQQARVIPNIDAKLGLDWAYHFCGCSRSTVTVEAGYMVSHYFNALNRELELSTFSPTANHTSNTFDVSFDGPYLSIQLAI